MTFVCVIRRVEKGSTVLYKNVMIGRWAIIKILLGHSDNDRVEFHDIQFQRRPVPCQPLRQRTAAMTENEAALRFGHQRQRRHHHLTVGEEEIHRVDFPHRGVERPIQHEIPEEIIFANTDLLVRTFLLIDGGLQSLERVESHGSQQSDGAKAISNTDGRADVPFISHRIPSPT